MTLISLNLGVKSFFLFIPFYYQVLPGWQDMVNEGDLTREITDFVHRRVEHKQRGTDDGLELISMKILGCLVRFLL